MLRRVPPPSPFTPSLPVPPTSGIARLSQGVHSSQATSSTQSLQPPTLPFSQATPSSQIPIPHPYVLKPVRTPVAILGSLGVCIYVPASRHWLISYSPIHLT